MHIGPTQIADTYAEAFDMSYVRLIVTAHDMTWLEAAVQEVSGYASSVIACDVEAGLEKWIDSSQTPDGRPGASLLLFGFSATGLAGAVPPRVGQCLMTCPSTAVYDGLPTAQKRITLGKNIRFFGDCRVMLIVTSPLLFVQEFHPCDVSFLSFSVQDCSLSHRPPLHAS